MHSTPLSRRLFLLRGLSAGAGAALLSGGWAERLAAAHADLGALRFFTPAEMRAVEAFVERILPGKGKGGGGRTGGRRIWARGM
jgi:hypothetical protein